MKYVGTEEQVMAAEALIIREGFPLVAMMQGVQVLPDGGIAPTRGKTPTLRWSIPIQRYDYSDSEEGEPTGVWEIAALPGNAERMLAGENFPLGPETIVPGTALTVGRVIAALHEQVIAATGVTAE